MTNVSKQQISELLFREWDPLGVKGFAPADEYDDYAEHIAQLLGKGVPSGDIGSYLSEVRATWLLVPPGEETDRRVAESIEALHRGRS